MPSTLLLDVVEWDLTLDVYGNLAVADEPYALAQDAASAIRTFKGELYYDTSVGIPYFEQILGHWPPLAIMKAYFKQAALTVTGVVDATSYITAWSDRTVIGQVQVATQVGKISSSLFSIQFSG